MYCPSCSTQAVEGAKFCKSCGMNLSVISQAITGAVVVSDPIRDREYKRARKQISDGIHGLAIGTALVVAAGVAHFYLQGNTTLYFFILVFALSGVVYLFRSFGKILDAKVGPKLLDPALQPRGTGGLNNGLPAQTPPVNVRPSQRLPAGPGKPISETRPVALEEKIAAPPALPSTPLADLPRMVTGRVNREHSSPLSRIEKEGDLMSKLRN